MVVDAWYSNGQVERITNTGLFTVVPAILGEAELNSSDPKVAASTTVYISHRDYAGVSAPVTLKGVMALGDYNNVPRDITTYPITKEGRVVGDDGSGVSFLGSFGAFFEDGPPLTQDLLDNITVLVKYQGLWATDAAKSSYETEISAGNPISGSAAAVIYPSANFEKLTLTPNHLFIDDYTTNFLSDSLTLPRVKYAYGVDPTDSKVNILISKGLQHGMKPDTDGSPAWNTSIYIKVPFSTYYWVRDMEVTSITWGSETAPYVLQTVAMERTKAQWETALQNGNIQFKVYYHGTEITQDRNRYDFYRAIKLGRAGVYNEPVKVTQGTRTGQFKLTDDDDYGDIAIGYYSSLTNDPIEQLRNPIRKGDFPSVDVLKVPIALFQEGSGTLVMQSAANPKDKNLTFVHDTTARETAGRMSDKELLALQNTYEFRGVFRYDTYTSEPQVIIPGSDFRKEFFTPPNPFVTGTEMEDVEVTFTVPSATILSQFTADGKTELRRSFGTGNLAADYPTTYPTAAAKKAISDRYAVFAGEEAEFTARVYPAGYDDK